MLQNLEKSHENPASSIDIMIKPLELIIDSNLQKCYLTILTIFQNFAGSNLLTYERKISFIDHGMKLFDSSIDIIPIKVLQILLMSFSRSDILRDGMASKVLKFIIIYIGT